MSYYVGTMERIGIRELKQQTSAVMRRVAGGETVEVTDHGHPVARIVPLRPGPLQQLILEGRITPARRDPRELLEELGLPLPAVPGQKLPSQILEEMRADDR